MIRIGNAGGFWGDDLDAFRRQLETGDLDYLTMDFLAEITMSILRKQQLKNPDLGYITDFVDQVVDNIDIINGSNIRIITNAGGMNPLGCARKILSRLQEINQSIRLAVIDGDDILEKISHLYPEKADFTNLETGESFEDKINKIQSANVYLGLPPLLKALQSDSQIILTGRVTDTSITMAPMVHEFGWELTDWDKLASGIVAGHIIECGAQSSGGNFTDWQKINSWENFGYPIVEAYPDGSFIVTKAEHSGGIVTIDSIKEQILYEMGDPSGYISPDVIADFTTIKLVQEGPERVKISNVKGYPATPYYKVSMSYIDGLTTSGTLIVSGPDAYSKARKIKDIFWNRLGVSYQKQNTEYVGFNACHLNLATPNEPNEILIRFSVYDEDREKLESFSKNIAPLILSGPPGMAVTGGRPRISQVITYWPALIRKDLVKSRLKILDDRGEIIEEQTLDSITGYESDFKSETADYQETKQGETLEHDEGVTVKLKDLCLARSGDKGDTANIGVVARNQDIYQYLKKHLTAGVVKYMFKEHCKGRVVRYSLDNLQALNFLLESSLDDGGTKSLRIDAQGKTYAQAFLKQEIMVPDSLLKTIKHDES